MSQETWRGWFEDVPGYLDSATVGLPPILAVDEVVAALESWRHGQSRPQEYDEYVDRGRRAWARIVGVPAETVAVGSTVSGLVGPIASSLPEGARVLVAAGDFTSVLFPFLVQQETARLTVREVALEDLVASIDEGTDLVAVSAVQSSDGRRVDVEALVDAAAVHGARVLLDITQSCGWLPLDCTRIDYVVCAGYKWLLCPRGVAFLALRPDRLDGVTPTAAGWYAGADVWSSIYGTPLRLAADARRLDTSPAWFSWVGAAPALELLAQLDIGEVCAHNIGLADRFLTSLDLPPADSAIVTVTRDGAVERLAAAGVRTSARAGRARLSFHLYTEQADVDRAVAALSAAPGRG
jgi:selenocysteine lyase/cysteine desulfurase